jgi:hypothetical protein
MRLTIGKENEVSDIRSARSSLAPLETGNGPYEPYRGAGPSIVVTGYDTAATVPNHPNRHKVYTFAATLYARLRFILVVMAFIASMAAFAASVSTYAVYAKNKNAGKVLPSGRWWVAWPDNMDLAPTIAIMVISTISLVIDTGFLIGSLRKDVSQPH